MTSPHQIEWAQRTVKQHHYLHQQANPASRPGGYLVRLNLASPGLSDNSISAAVTTPVPAPLNQALTYGATDTSLIVGLLLFGRPEATRVKGWYNSNLLDREQGKVACDYWEIINLARVWLNPLVQPGGGLYKAELLPGYKDRSGVWRSVLGSSVVKMALEGIGFDYLMQYAPVHLGQPYQIHYCLSYYDTRLHRGNLYRASGFELYRTNQQGIQTWRKPVPELTSEQDLRVRQASLFSPPAQKKRAEVAQHRWGAQTVMELWDGTA